LVAVCPDQLGLKLFLIIDINAVLNKMRYIMPAKSPLLAKAAAEKIAILGQQIRAHRKGLRISATTSAEAAGMSRVTLHRIETGEPSVTMGAYISAMDALGLNFAVSQPTESAVKPAQADRQGWIPARISIADYPQLRLLAWQVHGTDALSPAEAHSIYERNWRHVDIQALEPTEQQLIDALRTAFGSEHV
jgi:transcriptional regulator with XRE-family HTH domain